MLVIILKMLKELQTFSRNVSQWSRVEASVYHRDVVGSNPIWRKVGLRRFTFCFFF